MLAAQNLPQTLAVQTGDTIAPRAQPALPTGETTDRTQSPSSTQAAEPAQASAPAGDFGWATHYGESFNGQPLGCGSGPYSSSNPTIVAISPERFASWPCGTSIEICGPAGCIVGVRQDACPGCSANVLDLSEAGNAAVCGEPAHTCTVSFRAMN